MTFSSFTEFEIERFCFRKIGKSKNFISFTQKLFRSEIDKESDGRAFTDNETKTKGEINDWACYHNL